MKKFFSITVLFQLYLIICWIINIIGLFNLSFDGPSYKIEIIKAIGVIVPPLAGITVYW